MKKVYSNLIELTLTIVVSALLIFLITIFEPNQLKDSSWYMKMLSFIYITVVYLFSIFIYTCIIYFFFENSVGKKYHGLQLRSVFGHMTVFRFFVREYLFKYIILVVYLWNVLVINNTIINFVLLLILIVQYGLALMIYVKNKTFILDNLLFTVVEDKE